MLPEYVKGIRKKIGHDRLIVVGAAVIVYEGGKVLLQRRRDNAMWGIHGGSVEVGERVEDAARRELAEETGLVAGRLELLGVYSGDEMMFTYPNGDEVYIVGVTYVCGDFRGEPAAETDETLELRWFDLRELPDGITPPDVRPLRDFAAIMARDGGWKGNGLQGDGAGR